VLKEGSPSKRAFCPRYSARQRLSRGEQNFPKIIGQHAFTGKFVEHSFFTMQGQVRWSSATLFRSGTNVDSFVRNAYLASTANVLANNSSLDCFRNKKQKTSLSITLLYVVWFNFGWETPALQGQNRNEIRGAGLLMSGQRPFLCMVRFYESGMKRLHDVESGRVGNKSNHLYSAESRLNS
jgi:hypothetical protein